MRFMTDELREVAILEALPEWQTAWFADRGERVDLAPGDRLFERGDPADFMFIVVKGTVQRYEEIGGQWLLVATTRQGEVTGMLPYSRMTRYPGNTVAVETCQVLRVKKSDFQEMLSVSQEVGRRLVAVMSDRVRGDVRLEQQQERMAALGQLSAGLAHELNNPAAAALRSADALLNELAKVSPQVLKLLSHQLEPGAIEALSRLQGAAQEGRQSELSALERSEREEEIAECLESCGLEDGWSIAEPFVEAGLSVDALEEFTEQVPSTAVPDALAWVACTLGANRMVAEISSSAARISELVASVKTYSHMDRSPEHKPTDVREGLDNTITMLGHKLKSKRIHLTRNYQEDLPTIPGNAGELNLVWTNLIDNAVGAMSDGGRLKIEVHQEDIWVAVRVIDDGHGIPEDIRAHIFEPFFTTRAVGEGTGLGLDIAMRIAKTHRGDIEVQSRPGRTEMCVRLPLTPAFPGGEKVRA